MLSIPHADDMNMFLLLLLTVARVVHSATEIEKPSNARTRLNWGINFYKTSIVLNGVTNFRAVFSVPLLDTTFYPLELIDCNTPTLIELHCSAINDMIKEMNGRNSKRFEQLESWYQKIIATIPEVDGIRGDGQRQHKQSTKRRRRRRRSTQTLKPDFCKDIEQGKDGTPGGGTSILGALGRVFGSLAELPSFADIANLDGRICQLASIAASTSEALSNLDDKWSATERMDELEGALSQEDARINEIGQNLITLANKELARENLIMSHIDREEAAQELLMRVVSHMHSVRSAVDDYADWHLEFRRGVNKLLSGMLPNTFVSPDDIENMVNHIESSIVKDQNRLRLVDANVGLYYMAPLIFFTRSVRAKALYIQLSMPLYTIGGKMTAYRIDRTHITVHEGTAMSTRIENLPDFLLVSEDGHYYSEMTTSQMVACKGLGIKNCPTERSLQKFNEATCASALYQDNAQDIMRLCDIRIGHEVEPSSAIRLHDHTFLLHSAHAVTNHTERAWTMHCPQLRRRKATPRATVTTTMGVGDDDDGNDDDKLMETFTRTTSVPICSTCIMKIDCGCELDAGNEFFIPLQLSNCDDNNFSGTVRVSLRYPVNLAVLHTVFTTREMAKIAMDTSTTDSKPYTFDIPHLKAMHYNWIDTVEKSEKYSASLNATVTSMKAYGRAYATKADKYLSKALDMHELNNAHFNDVYKLFSGLKWLSMFDPTTSVGGVSVLLFITVVSIVMSCYNCFWPSRR